MAEKKKKSIFDKAIDALTDRDEKAAAAQKIADDKAETEKILAERAAFQKTAAEKAAAVKTAADKAAADKAAAVKASADKAAADRTAAAAAQAAAQRAATMKAAADKAAADKTAATAKLAAAQAAETAKSQFIGEYTIGSGDTLSHVALKFYGNAGRDYWMHVYEANKEVIGSNPGMVRVGTVLKIPALPDNLKK